MIGRKIEAIRSYSNWREALKEGGVDGGKVDWQEKLRLVS